MKKFIVENIKVGNNFVLDFSKAREEMQSLGAYDYEQCEEILRTIEKLNLKFAFRFSVFFKCDCGHWEHNQTTDGKVYVTDRCTRCVIK